MHYTIYKVTNLINGKYYIGKHQTKNLNDGYMGSGKLIKQAIEKNGIENFKKEILHIFDNEEDMNAKEAELVVINENTYNLCPGGKGGFSYINNSGINKFKGKKHSEESKPKMGHPNNTHFKNKTHNENTKSKISNTLKGRKRSPESIAKQKEIWRQKRLDKAGEAMAANQPSKL